MWFILGLIVLLIAFFTVTPIIDKWTDQKRMKRLGFIEVEATIFGGVKAVTRLNNPESGGYEERILGEHYLMLEFPLHDGSMVRVKSARIKKVDIRVGAKIKIAYNPEDARDLYLLE